MNCRYCGVKEGEQHTEGCSRPQLPPLPSQETLEEWLAYWKPLLGLHSWVITVELVSENELGDRHSAECWPNYDNRYAIIKIANDERSEDYLRPDLKDYEHTLVHELLHCVFDPAYAIEIQGNRQADLLYEQAINATALALVCVKRSAEGDNGMNVGAIAGILGSNPYLLMLGKVLDSKTDWKAMLAKQGANFAKVELQKRWEKRVDASKLTSIAKGMNEEGWSWQKASDPNFLREQKVSISEADRALGPGFVISRDAIYSILRETGVPGGAVRDGWRDSLDNKVWEGIKDRVDAQTPISSIVNLTFHELVRTVL